MFIFWRFSGISEKDLKEDCPSVGEVQQTLLRFVSVDTILVGHGLETSLCALKVSSRGHGSAPQPGDMGQPGARGHGSSQGHGSARGHGSA